MTQEAKQEANKTSKAQEVPETYKVHKVLSPKVNKQKTITDRETLVVWPASCKGS